MSYQITLFDLILEQKVNILLQALNEGLALNDQYVAHSTLKLRNRMLLTAINRQKQVLFNIVDKNGDTPAGMLPAWRSAAEIEIDLKLTNND